MVFSLNQDTALLARLSTLNYQLSTFSIMSTDLQAISIDELKARVGELRRYL